MIKARYLAALLLVQFGHGLALSAITAEAAVGDPVACECQLGSTKVEPQSSGCLYISVCTPGCKKPGESARSTTHGIWAYSATQCGPLVIPAGGFKPAVFEIPDPIQKH